MRVQMRLLVVARGSIASLVRASLPRSWLISEPCMRSTPLMPERAGCCWGAETVSLIGALIGNCQCMLVHARDRQESCCRKGVISCRGAQHYTHSLFLTASALIRCLATLRFRPFFISLLPAGCCSRLRRFITMADKVAHLMFPSPAAREVGSLPQTDCCHAHACSNSRHGFANVYSLGMHMHLHMHAYYKKSGCKQRTADSPFSFSLSPAPTTMSTTIHVISTC
jgi:hypothetical protein